MFVDAGKINPRRFVCVASYGLADVDLALHDRNMIFSSDLVGFSYENISIRRL